MESENQGAVFKVGDFFIAMKPYGDLVKEYPYWGEYMDRENGKILQITSITIDRGDNNELVPIIHSSPWMFRVEWCKKVQ